jgi:hypothetical protein
VGILSKQALYTTLGIAVSFAVAFGGWTFVNGLINTKSDTLLSVTGDIYVSASRVEEESEEEPLFPTLSDYEIAAVLQSREMEWIYEQPHEPIEGQLSMEQAIRAGEEGLNYFIEQGVIPLEFSDRGFSRVNAHLSQYLERTRSQEVQMLEPFYSFWSIAFSSERLSVEFDINAVTGQIWSAEIGFTSSDKELMLPKVNEMLDSFTGYLNLESGSWVEITDYGVKRDYNMFSAFVRSISRAPYARIGMGLFANSTQLDNS